MSVLESVSGFTWLYSTLSGDATLTTLAPGGVWRGLAPPDTTTPFIVMVYQSGNDVVTMNGFRMMVDALYQVKAVGPASATSALTQAASRADELIKLQVGTVAGGAILSCYRQSQLQLDELINGELWSNFGGLYRIIIEQVNQ